jgi:hypothetical protein
MDILKKVETLISATTRSALPRRRRRNALDEYEENLLAEIRQALAAVEAQEQILAKRIKMERAQAEEAGQVGDRTEQRAHERRAEELERELQEESIQAIDLEEKLQALEEKLALAQEAVEKQAQIVAEEDERLAQVITESSADSDTAVDIAQPKPAPDDATEIEARKSRLSG